MWRGGEEKEAFADEPVLERAVISFETLQGWKILTEGLELKAAEGVNGNCLAFIYELGEGREYVVLSKDVALTLPDNFAFSFHIRGSGPRNTLEFKLVDEHGNVFWKKREDFRFPGDWTKLHIEKREIQFAWGFDLPARLDDTRRIEIAVSRTSGGKGEVFLDELSLSGLPPGKDTRVRKSATCSSAENEKYPAAPAIDGDKGTRWSSAFSDPQWLEIDFGREKDMIGVLLYWEAAHTRSYDVLVSNDRENWTTAFTTAAGDGVVDDIDFDKMSARYLKITREERATAYAYSLYEVAPKTPAQPWGEGEPADLFLPSVLEFRTDPDNTQTPEAVSAGSDQEGWTHP